MSYILEALKKAERARELGDVPGLHSMHDQPPRHAPRRWPWVLVAALLLNVLLIAGLWWRGWDDHSAGVSAHAPVAESVSAGVAQPAPVAPRPAPAVQVEKTDPPAAAGVPVAQPVSPAPAIAARPLRPLPLPTPAPVSAEPAQAKAGPAPAPAAAPMVPHDIVTLKSPTTSPPPATPQQEPAWKRLPLWPLVPEGIRRQVSGRLVLNAHVYSDIRAERFVLFNMTKYGEGEQIPEGPRVEEITRDGVILGVPNGRFRLE